MEHKLIAFYEQTLEAPEQQEVEQWLAENPEHWKIYEETITVWKNAAVTVPYKHYNKQQAWEKLQQQIEETTVTGTTGKGRVVRFTVRKAMAVAASIAVAVLLFLWIGRPVPEHFTATTEHELIKLKDQSEVTLYADASLTVAGDFNRKNRTVTLKGNAYFDIAKNREKPFIIHSNDLDVEVLGTTFTIQQTADFNTVFVHSGKVQASFGDKKVIATANQKIVKNNLTGQLLVLPVHTDIKEILHSRIIKVKDIRVDSLTNMLKELYNIQIELAPGLETKKVTSTYLIRSETPEQIMENIALMIDARWSKNKNNQYIISK